MRSTALLNRTFKVAAFGALTLAALSLGAACRSTSNQNQPFGIVVINAPAAGEVRRILVGEGVEVKEGAALFEIAVPQPSAASATPGESAETRAVRNMKSSQAEIEAARAEAVKHQAQVERLTPLVASGQASQAELDGERALYERAQQRLHKAQDAERQAQSGLIASRQPGAQSASAPAAAPREQIITARATSDGTVAVISARVGQRVTLGQPLATLRTTK